MLKRFMLVAAFVIGVLPAACSRAPSPASSRSEPSAPASTIEAEASLADLARTMSVKAASKDTTYFAGFAAAREIVPQVIDEVARSGIATNYVEHLTLESSSTARLVYHDLRAGTTFSVDLERSGDRWTAKRIILLW